MFNLERKGICPVVHKIKTPIQYMKKQKAKRASKCVKQLNKVHGEINNDHKRVAMCNSVISVRGHHPVSTLELKRCDGHWRSVLKFTRPR
jgi:hypothetical protein